MRTTLTVTALAALLVVPACAGPAAEQEPREQSGQAAAGSELACNHAARQRYLDAAAAAGLTVEGTGDAATVVARSEAEKKIAADLHARQIAEFEACRRP